MASWLYPPRKHKRDLNEFERNKVLPRAALIILTVVIFIFLVNAAFSVAYAKATAPHPDCIAAGC